MRPIPGRKIRLKAGALRPIPRATQEVCMFLLLSALVPIAHAACDTDAPSIVDMLPADGSIGVPQSASVGAFVGIDPQAFAVALLDEDGEEVPTRRSVRTWTGADLAAGEQHLVLLTPNEELTEGQTYTVTASLVDKAGEDAVESSFVVGAAADIAPTPPRLSVLASDVENGLDDCDHPQARRFQAEMTGLDDTWAGSGFVSVYATWSGGGLDRLVGVFPSPADGEILSFDAVLPITGEDGPDCLSAVAEGETRKPSEPVLACAPAAPTGKSGEFEGGAGCNTAATPAAGLLGVIGGLAALFWRRRDED